MKGYHLLTLTHRQASLDEIGRIVLPETEGVSLGDRLSELKSRFGWDELLYLATCNRVIFFFYTKNEVSDRVAHQFLMALRPDANTCPPACLALKMGLFHGENAISHLYEVAASVDSLVIGEREIFRQLREAEERCKNWGITGDHVRVAMRFAVVAAKDVYSRTGIGEKPVSVVSLAFQQMEMAGLKPNSRVLLIGAGQTNALLAKFLLKKGIRKVAVFNRSREKAAEIARAFAEGEAFSLEELADYRGGFDQLVACTSAGRVLVDETVFDKLNMGETARKTLVDLAVPANIDVHFLRKKNAQLIDIEQLKAQAEINRGHRERELFAAKKIIAEHVSDFKMNHRQRQAERALDFLPDEIRSVRERAMSVFQKDLEKMDPESRRVVVEMLGYMEKKCIGIPMKAAKAMVKLGPSSHF